MLKSNFDFSSSHKHPHTSDRIRTLLTYIREHSHYVLYCIFFIRYSTPHHIYFQFFFTFFFCWYLYIPFGAASKQIFLCCVKSSICAFFYCMCFGAATRIRMLGNVIQHDDQRQIALLCKNMNKIPFISWANHPSKWSK